MPKNKQCPYGNNQCRVAFRGIARCLACQADDYQAAHRKKRRAICRKVKPKPLAPGTYYADLLEINTSPALVEVTFRVQGTAHKFTVKQAIK